MILGNNRLLDEANMFPRNLRIVRLLIRQNLPGGNVGFLVFPHEHWKIE